MGAETRPRVTIVGGSIGGLLAGSLFLRQGWDVQVYERTDGILEGRGAGITILPGLMAGLRAAGVAASEDELGVRLPERHVLNLQGEVIAETTYPQVMTSWKRLFDELRGIFPDERYHGNMNFESFDQDADRVVARFSDGTAVESELLLACDGNRSTLRTQVLPGVTPHYPGYIAWRSLTDEGAFSEQTHATLFGRYNVCLTPGQQAVGYPVPGVDHRADPGSRQFNVVWYHPVPEEGLADLMTDATGTHHPFGIPPGLIRDDVLAHMREQAQQKLAPQFAEAVERARVQLFQPIADLECPRLVDGRVVIVGDAAFLARPHTAMGVPKAAGDLRVLLEQVGDASGDLAARLARFEAERIEVDTRIVQRGKYLGEYMEAQLLGTDADRARVERERDPQQVMLETAAPIDYE